MKKWWTLLWPAVQAVLFGSVLLINPTLPAWVQIGVAFMAFLCGVQVGQELTDACRGLGNWNGLTGAARDPDPGGRP